MLVHHTNTKKAYVLCVLGTDAGALHDQLFVSQLHAIKTSTSLPNKTKVSQPQNLSSHATEWTTCKIATYTAISNIISSQVYLERQVPITIIANDLWFNQWTGFYLVGDIWIDIFAESVTLRETSGGILHQIESFKWSKWRQQLLHLKHSMVQFFTSLHTKILLRSI